MSYKTQVRATTPTSEPQHTGTCASTASHCTLTLKGRYPVHRLRTHCTTCICPWTNTPLYPPIPLQQSFSKASAKRRASQYTDQISPCPAIPISMSLCNTTTGTRNSIVPVADTQHELPIKAQEAESKRHSESLAYPVYAVYKCMCIGRYIWYLYNTT